MRGKVTVQQLPESGRWAVLDDGKIIAEFETNREAWRWLDRHERRELWCRRETADWRDDAVYYAKPDRDGSGR
jgi:hypothetical protein